MNQKRWLRAALVSPNPWRHATNRVLGYNTYVPACRRSRANANSSARNACLPQKEISFVRNRCYHRHALRSLDLHSFLQQRLLGLDAGSVLTGLLELSLYSFALSAHLKFGVFAGIKRRAARVVIRECTSQREHGGYLIPQAPAVDATDRACLVPLPATQLQTCASWISWLLIRALPQITRMGVRRTFTDLLEIALESLVLGSPCVFLVRCFAGVLPQGQHLVLQVVQLHLAFLRADEMNAVQQRV